MVAALASVLVVHIVGDDLANATSGQLEEEQLGGRKWSRWPEEIMPSGCGSGDRIRGGHSGVVQRLLTLHDSQRESGNGIDSSLASAQSGRGTRAARK